MPAEPITSTAIHPPTFFAGTWSGHSEMKAARSFALIVPKSTIKYSSQVTRLSESLWKTKECLQFSSGFRTERIMYGEVFLPDRAHVTADDMPGGADLMLTADRFDSLPYYMWVPYAGRRWWIRCTDRNHVDQDGTIHNTINIRFARIPVVTISLTIRRCTG